MRMLVLGILCGLVLTGCASFQSFLNALESHQVSSCIRWQGTLALGAGIGGNGLVQAITKTGEATMEQCLEAFKGQVL